MKISEKIMLEGTRSDLLEYFKEKFKSGEWHELGNDGAGTLKTTVEKQLDKCKAVIQGEKNALWGKVGLVYVMSRRSEHPIERDFQLIPIWVRVYPEYYWDMVKDKHEMGMI